MAPREGGGNMREYTMAEVAAMGASEGTAVVVVDGVVYDVSKWKHAHPGGEALLNTFSGHDASDAFRVFHPDDVRERMKTFAKGVVVDVVESEISKDFRELHEAFVAEGLYESSMWYFVAKFCMCLAALGASLWVGWHSGSYGWPVAAAGLSGLLMALHFHQLAFMGHDLCHNGVTHVREYDYVFSLTVGGILGGISSGWWKKSHNHHHCVTNSVPHDPDIQHLPVFGLSTLHLDGFFSHYHQRFMAYDVVAKTLIRAQAWLYYPIMAVARFNLYIQSWIMLVKEKRVEYRGLEIASLAGFAVWYTAFVVYAFETGWQRFAFLAVSNGVAGILHVQITLSHFAMEVFENDEVDVFATDFVRAQALTSMDVDSTWFTHWFHGGLQYQVEHHLFPRMPRHTLTHVRERIAPLFRKHNIPLVSVSFYEANRMVISALAKTAADASLKHGSWFVDALNWRG